MDSAPGKIELEYPNRIALVPGIIKGTRTICVVPLVPRQSQSAIGIEIGDPVALAGPDFRSVVRLRDQGAAIDALCREPDQEELVKPEPMFPAA